MAGVASALKRLFALAVLTSELMERGMLARGLTRAQASVLWALHQRGLITQRELADLIGVTPCNITGLVDALKGDGFAELGPHPTDRCHRWVRRPAEVIYVRSAAGVAFAGRGMDSSIGVMDTPRLRDRSAAVSVSVEISSGPVRAAAAVRRLPFTVH